MKIVVYERSVGASPERVGLRLNKVAKGFIAERFLIQDDQTLLTQVLPMACRSDFEEFAKADPFYMAMESMYREVTTLVWGDE